MKPTREQIENGTREELRRWTAMLMGWSISIDYPYLGCIPGTTTMINLPYYASNIGEAWKVVVELSDKYSFRLSDISAGNKLWQASFEIRDGHYRFPIEHAHKGDAHANERTPAMAICRAALLAAWRSDENQGY